VANHISWLDIMALHSVAAMGFVAKAEIKSWPFLGFLATTGGTLYHRRGSHDSSTGVMAALLQRLGQGGRVAVFPEGGILPGEEIKRFHARMFAVVVEADCPVQPVMLRYLRAGKRDPQLTFLQDEGFAGNILRLMGRPACQVEMVCMEPFAVTGRPRRELAEQAFEMITAAYQAPVTAVAA
jgi:1-acyl-sn-glycerol-3-phosphate acyltransferase